jgi:hypothetical protein
MGIDYILKKAKELIQSGAIQSNISDSLIQAMEESPEGLNDLLLEIADQALDKHSGKDARRLYGNELVGYAIAYKVSLKQAEKKLDLNESNLKVKGGLADKLSVKDIAEKFGVTTTKIERELNMGIKVELEHTKDKAVAKDIAMDHLAEMPDYYTRLNRLEDTATKYWSKKEIKESLHAKLLSNLKP